MWNVECGLWNEECGVLEAHGERDAVSPSVYFHHLHLHMLMQVNNLVRIFYELIG